MALIKSWADPQTGLSLPNAYHRINGIVIDYEAKQVQFVVLIYRDQAARAAGRQPLQFATRQFGVRNLTEQDSTDAQPHAEFDERFAAEKLDTINPVRQAYDWLKLHPLYRNAADI